MRVFCGDAEVTPIHPFKIEHRVGADDVVYEGLYIFDPAAIGPHCGTVKLTLFSDKEPDQGGHPRHRSEDRRADLEGLRAIPRRRLKIGLQRRHDGRQALRS